jgi:hypothetical protein
VVLRELMPQDLKIEVDRLTRGEATALARYLAGVVGRAHGRQMDGPTRKAWRAELGPGARQGAGRPVLALVQRRRPDRRARGGLPRTLPALRPGGGGMRGRRASLAGAPLARLWRLFEARPGTAFLEAAARCGYVARGAVYLSVGVIALLAALRLSPHAKGAVGALEAWGDWPVGLLLLWLVALGLCAFAGWRALQSVFDVDGCGRTAHGLASRAGQAISGLTYAALAASVFGLIATVRDLHEADEQATTRAFVSGVLDLPYGAALVTGMGLFVVAAGLGSIVRAALRPLRPQAGL